MIKESIPSSAVERALGTLSFSTERGILSAIYLGFLAFGLILGSKQPVIEQTLYVGAAVVCLLLGLIVSNITYEALITPFRWFTEPIVLRSFNKTVEGVSQMRFSSYEEIRKLREDFLASDGPQHLKTAIVKEIRLRQTLTYLSSSSILGLIMLYVASRVLDVFEIVITIELWFISYVLLATFIGEASRSASIGRFIGLAYLSGQGVAASEANRESAPISGGQVKPELCLDFDGVLHWYRNGWQGATVIDDIPVPGARKFVQEAEEHFHIVVYSSRSNHSGGIEALRKWMKRHGFPEVEFPTEKPRALVTIDDHAITFNGNWPNPSDLLKFRPWYLTDSAANNSL